MSVNKYEKQADANVAVGDGVGTVGIQEGMPRRDVNNAMRSMCADIAKYYEDNTYLLTTGAADAFVVTTASQFTAYVDGLSVWVKFHVAPNDDATVNLNSLGATPLKTFGADGLAEINAGDIAAGQIVRLTYDGLSFVASATGAKSASFTQRSQAIAASIGGGLSSILVNCWDASVDANWGRAIYKRSDAAEVAGYPALSWFQSADGAYWLLDEDVPQITMFGGHKHEDMSELTHAGAVDSTAAIDAGRAYALARGVPLYVFGYYKYDGNLLPSANEALVGPGRKRCGIQFWNASLETGYQIKTDGVTVQGVELQAYLYEAKPSGGGTGMLGVPLIVGNFSDGDVPQPKGYYIDDVLLTRKDNETGHTSYNGWALQVSGGSNQGFIGFVDIGTRHSGAVMSHWTGDNSVTHGAHTESVHPRNYTMQKVMITGQVGTALTLSSASNLQIGSVIAETVRQLLVVLPGDDIDDNNIGAANVGAGVRIDELVCNSMATAGLTGTNDDALTISSLGTSKFQTEGGQPKKDQMRMDISIGTLTMNTADAALVYGIDLFEFFGSFVVERARVTGFKEAYRARYSRGDIRVNFEFTDGRCEALDSDSVLTGSFDRGDPSGNGETGTVVESRNVYVNSTTWSLAASDITRGDTSVTVPTGITQDVPRGGTIELTGTTASGVETLAFVVDGFTEVGLTTLDIGYALPHNMTGVTVKYVGDSDVTVDAVCMKGSRTGVFVEGGKCKVRGKIRAGRFNVYGLGVDSVIDYNIDTPVSGLSRGFNEAYTVYDAFFEDGAVATISGNLGAAKVSASGAYYSIGATGTPDAKVHLRDGRVVDASKVVVANDGIDFSVNGCYTDAGDEFTIFDTLGIDRVGSDANGHFQRNPDGTMECWARNVNVGATQPYDWTFPGGGFIATASTAVQVTPASPTQPRMGHGNATSAAIGQVWVHNHDGTDAPNTGVNLYAKGYWK